MHKRWNSLALLALALALPCTAAERSADWIRQRVGQVKDSDTNGWRKIPWTASLLEARVVSRREGQPLFLFTLDGNIDTGRC